MILVNSSPCSLAVNDVPSGWVRITGPLLAGDAEVVIANSEIVIYVSSFLSPIVLPFFTENPIFVIGFCIFTKFL